MSDTAKGVALVTGAAARIGRAIALALADAGYDVAVHYNRSAEAASATQAEIEAAGRKAAAMKADLSLAADCSALIGQVRRALGPVRVLINNASIFENDTLSSLTAASWNAHLDVNLRAPALLTQAFAAALPDGANANVINVIDQRVWRLTPYFLSYTMSKSGLWALTQTCAMALAPRVRVNAIGPGPVLASERQSAEEFERQARSTPLGRGASPEEIGAAVQFILATPAMTGQMIALDGGQHLGNRKRSDSFPE